MKTLEKAKKEYQQLVRKAKNKDAALSAFDRNHYAGKYGAVNGELAAAIAEHFRAIRDARFQRRHRQDIGRIADPTVLQFGVIEQAVKKCTEVLNKPAAHTWIEVLACLLLVTGRRTAEVVGNTEFSLKWFRGTVKRQDVSLGRANYLVPFRYVSKGLAHLESLGMRGLSPRDANKKCAVPLHRNVTEIFPFVKKPHDLRAIHVAYLRYLTGNKQQVKKMEDKDRAEYMGDLINDQLAHSNVLSAIPYLKFKVQ